MVMNVSTKVEKNPYGAGWVGQVGTVRVEGKVRAETQRALDLAVEKRLNADPKVVRYGSDYAGDGTIRVVSVYWEVMLDQIQIALFNPATDYTSYVGGSWDTVAEAVLDAERWYPRRTS